MKKILSLLKSKTIIDSIYAIVLVILAIAAVDVTVEGGAVTTMTTTLAAVIISINGMVCDPPSFVDDALAAIEVMYFYALFLLAVGAATTITSLEKSLLIIIVGLLTGVVSVIASMINVIVTSIAIAVAVTAAGTATKIGRVGIMIVIIEKKILHFIVLCGNVVNVFDLNATIVVVIVVVNATFTSDSIASAAEVIITIEVITKVVAAATPIVEITAITATAAVTVSIAGSRFLMESI